MLPASLRVLRGCKGEDHAAAAFLVYEFRCLCTMRAVIYQNADTSETMLVILDLIWLGEGFSSA
jgi:hypothetical protein